MNQHCAFAEELAAVIDPFIAIQVGDQKGLIAVRPYPLQMQGSTDCQEIKVNTLTLRAQLNPISAHIDNQRRGWIGISITVGGRQGPGVSRNKRHDAHGETQKQHAQRGPSQDNPLPDQQPPAPPLLGCGLHIWKSSVNSCVFSPPPNEIDMPRPDNATTASLPVAL